MSRLLLCLLILSLANTAYSWQKYAQPLELAKPNKDGVYEFEMSLSKKLSMHVRDGGKRRIVDYEPDTKSWFIRDSDELSSCRKRAPINESSLGDLVQRDGLHKRIILVSGRSPGTPIVVPYGAEVYIRVKNTQPLEKTSLHVHGVDKKNMWYADGAPYIQQCPIDASLSYSYRFIADTAGTHWYHGHAAYDKADGFLGGFVVKHPDETKYDRDYLAIVQDIPVMSTGRDYYTTFEWLGKFAYGYDNNEKCFSCRRIYDGTYIEGCFPIQALTVNEKGWHNQNDLRTRPSRLPLETFRIKSGEKSRLRFVNANNFNAVMVSVEGHKMTVVAADGAPVDKFMFLTAERYDVVIEGIAKPKKKTYRIIIENIDVYNHDMSLAQPLVGLANLEYEDSILEETDDVDYAHSTCTKKNKCTVLNCPFGQFGSQFPYTCIPAVDLESAELINDKEVLEAKHFTEGYQEHFYSMVSENGHPFRYPTSMPHYNMDRMNEVTKVCDPKCPLSTSNPRDPKCGCYYNYSFKTNDIVQMTMYNMFRPGEILSDTAHAMHFHGFHFYVMKMGFPTYDQKGIINVTNTDIPCNDKTWPCNALPWSDANWMDGNVSGMAKNPSLRDTIVIPPGGYTVIRFRASNPGWWLAHCHTMFHSIAGLGFAFRVGEPGEIPSPPEGFPHGCGNYDAPPLKK
ncbi:hypothetical protein QR680_000360 [Steinernema hermaphroditum]|uniref:L-ascorbate oxidase n=1 Tax=Steinernema hermaphroditum TaxID=289476 RepID=A0AA39GUA9_9BILA|nr:hypothetical protein QR680_000360 [Steinernema hermaphroditum]